MRYRELTSTYDGTIFSGETLFLVDSPAAVAQAVLTRLRLLQGEWFLDSTAGVPYSTQVIGFGTSNSRDVVIQSTILNTPGVNQLLTYSSSVVDRQFSVSATIDTIYGPQDITLSL